MDTTQEVIVRGRFITETGPLEGIVWFVPSHPWFWHKGKPYAVLAQHIHLNQGAFEAHLSRTDIKGLDFYYDVYSPVGHWKIKIVEDGPLQMIDLMPKGDRKK